MHCGNSNDNKQGNEEEAEEQYSGGWMGIQLTGENIEERKPFDLTKQSLVDSGATFSACNGKQLGVNVRKAAKPIKMNTNAGSRKIHDRDDYRKKKKDASSF